MAILLRHMRGFVCSPAQAPRHSGRYPYHEMGPKGFPAGKLLHRATFHPSGSIFVYLLIRLSLINEADRADRLPTNSIIIWAPPQWSDDDGCLTAECGLFLSMTGCTYRPLQYYSAHLSSCIRLVIPASLMQRSRSLFSNVFAAAQTLARPCPPSTMRALIFGGC